MALPVSGAISLNDVNVELANTATDQIDMNSAAVRGLFGIASGAISMSDGYGKSSQFTLVISSNVSNANLASLATAAGWDGTSELIATLNSGIYCSSTVTGTAGLTINGSFPGGVTFTNNGTIVGMGGRGGNGAGLTSDTSGRAGGLALLVQSAVSITNNGIIAGGGGGGGGGGRTTYNTGKSTYTYGGGGGGGGRSSLSNSAGGGGGTSSPWPTAPAGGVGTINAPGGGGTGQTGAGYTGSSGGVGGGWGAGGATGGPGSFLGSGGGGGAATSGQSNVTWLATGTRYGSLG